MTAAAPSTPETRIVVQQRTTEIKALMKRAASDIIEIGQKLIEVKARLGHGNFGTWLEAEFTWSQDTAGNFMNVARRFNEIPNGSEFAPRALYLLAAPSTPESAREEAIDRAGHGEAITHQAAREIVFNHRPPREIGVPHSASEVDYGQVESPRSKLIGGFFIALYAGARYTSRYTC